MTRKELDIQRVLRIADLVQHEADEWQMSCAVRVEDVLQWDQNAPWAEIRWYKLTKAVEFLRGLAVRMEKAETGTHHSESDEHGTGPDALASAATTEGGEA